MKTIRETKVWGSGGVTVSFSKDFELAFSQASTAIFGSLATWPNGGSDVWPNGAVTDFWPGGGQVADRLVRKALRGTVFSTQFSNLTGYATWSVHRVARHLREQREPSIVGAP